MADHWDAPPGTLTDAPIRQERSPSFPSSNPSPDKSNATMQMSAPFNASPLQQPADLVA